MPIKEFESVEVKFRLSDSMYIAFFRGGQIGFKQALVCAPDGQVEEVIDPATCRRILINFSDSIEKLQDAITAYKEECERLQCDNDLGLDD
jgi:hypothetical protein